MSGHILMASASGSINRLKIEGDSGHPCQVLFEIGKGWESILDV